MHKYLITAKCSFQNVRACKQSVWFVTDSRGNTEMYSLQRLAPSDLTTVVRRWHKADFIGEQCKDVESGKWIATRAVDQRYLTKSWGWQDHHSHPCLLFSQVFGGHPDPSRIVWRNRQRRGAGTGQTTVRTWNRGESRVCRLAGRLPALLIWDDVCIMTSCSLHCYFSQHHSLLQHPDHPGGLS